MIQHTDRWWLSPLLSLCILALITVPLSTFLYGLVPTSYRQVVLEGMVALWLVALWGIFVHSLRNWIQLHPPSLFPYTTRSVPPVELDPAFVTLRKELLSSLKSARYFHNVLRLRLFALLLKKPPETFRLWSQEVLPPLLSKEEAEWLNLIPKEALRHRWHRGPSLEQIERLCKQLEERL